MLYKSGDNLFSGAFKFISNSEEITLFSAYIKTDQLIKLDSHKKINRIIVRWEIRDLHQGASDLDLFKYCSENNIALFRNTRIHLKCLLNEKDQVFSGSANISARGMGEKDEFFNYELNSMSDRIELIDNIYLDRIISESELVTDVLYNKLKTLLASLEKFEKQDKLYKELDLKAEKKEDDYFLISELPTYNQIDQLYDKVMNIDSISDDDRKCISHDIATYRVGLEMSKNDFYKELKKTINSHPFILALKKEIINSQKQYMLYGSVVNWIVDNTTTVPTPVSWDLKREQVVNTLYKWICFFDDEFTVERPRHSEVIFYKKK